MKTIYWKDNLLYLLDQNLLPHEVEYLVCGTYQEVIEAIKTMVVRGAPAIGVAAAFGMALADQAGEDMDKVAKEIKDARPTAVNLSWAVDRVMNAENTLAEALKMYDEDLQTNLRMGKHGAQIIDDGDGKTAQFDSRLRQVAPIGSEVHLCASLTACGPIGRDSTLGLHMLDEVARRLGTTVLVQFDEPLLPAALAGRLAGASTLNTVHPIDESRASGLLDECAERVGGEVLVHCCAADVPWKLLQRSAIAAVSVDPIILDERGLDGLGEFLDAGRTVVLGLVASSAPQRPPSFEQVAASAAAITDRLGFPRAVLAERIGISPSCGLAGADEAWARSATGLCQKAGEALEGDPGAL